MANAKCWAAKWGLWGVVLGVFVALPVVGAKSTTSWKRVAPRVACTGQTVPIRPKPTLPLVGVAVRLEQDSLIAAAGFSCLIASIGDYISPRTVDDATFQQNAARFRVAAVPVCAVNIFLPADLKVVGPVVDESAILAYVEKVMARLTQTNTKMIVWGSGGSRRIPEGFDRATATRQFVAIARKIAAMAKRHRIVVVLENLNSGETNFINTVAEALQIVKAVGHPNLRLNADLYHMQKEGEAPDILLKTKKYLYHVEVAEGPNRTPPGTAGIDFRPYLRLLKKIGYHRTIVMECAWKQLAVEAPAAQRYFMGQLTAVYWGDGK